MLPSLKVGLSVILIYLKDKKADTQTKAKIKGEKKKRIEIGSVFKSANQGSGDNRQKVNLSRVIRRS